MLFTAFCNRNRIAIRENRHALWLFNKPVEAESGYTAERLSSVTQTWRIMQLTAGFLLIFCLSLSASTSSQTITYSGTNVPMEKIFNVIKEKTGYFVMRENTNPVSSHKISINVKNMQLRDFLGLILKDLGYDFTIRSKTIFIKEKKQAVLIREKPLLLYPELPPLRIHVVDSTGKPLHGASIVIGNKPSVITDKDGWASLDVLEGDLLTISYVGFDPVNYKVTAADLSSAQTFRTIRLKQSPNDMQEVVFNAGYYSVKDKQRTGSISRVTTKDIENQPVTNLLSAIQGRMAGVNITQYTGVPGGGYDIQIRGRNSLRVLGGGVVNSDGNQPLYVIDGVPVSEMKSEANISLFPMARISPLNNIDINTIANVEILKDADATAIYGSRGANGVVLITTKKGKSGKASISLNTAFALSKATSRLKMMNTEQYLDMRRQAFANGGVTQYPANAYDVNGTWDQNRYTDWRKELIGNTATSMNTQVSVNGGNETTSYLFTLSHSEQTTVFNKDFKYKTNTISNSIGHRSRDNRFRLNISNSFSLLQNNVISSDVTKASYILSPNAPALYKEDGSLNWENNTFANPVAPFQSTYSNDSKQFLTNINMQYELFTNFHFKLSSGINYQDFEEWIINPNTVYNPAYVAGQSAAYSNATKNNQDRFTIITEPQVNWNFKKEDHRFDILAGATFQQDKNRQGSMKGLGFQSNVFIRNIGAATTKIISDQIQTVYKYAAVFSRMNYQYKDRYIFNITARRDGSSRFGPNKRFGNFGAAGAAWVFSEEKFLKDLHWLSFGKLRTSYGSAGSDNIGDYQYLDTYTITSSLYDGVTSLNPTKLYNGDYSWEKTVKWDMALELGFLDDKINASLNWYRNRSSNQLVGYQLSAVTGFSSVQANLPATVENSGIEIELSANPLPASSGIQWKSALNLSIPKSKLISFPGLEGSPYASSYIVGYPTTIARLYHLEGIDPNTGLYRFTDYNHDGKIAAPDDNKIIKNVGVKFFGGWQNTIQFKNWELSFLLQFVKQNSKNYNATMGNPGLMFNQPVEVLNVWSAHNPNGVYSPYMYKYMPQQDFFERSDIIVSDGSYIRLKNIQMAYRIAGKSIFRDLRIYFQGQNLLTWTNYFGADPEFFALGYLPPLKSYSLGLQINF